MQDVQVVQMVQQAKFQKHSRQLLGLILGENDNCCLEVTTMPFLKTRGISKNKED